MGQKVTFHSDTKIIQVDVAPVGSPGGVVDIDVQADIFSDGKEDWLVDAELNKFRFPVATAGGDDLPGSKKLGATFFLEYGWKIRPYEASHQLNINGNLYSRDGSNPYVTTVGTYNVQIINTVSSLVDSTVQQITEIEYASFQNAVTVDIIDGVAGTEYPTGTSAQPVNNIADAVTICEDRGFSRLRIIGDVTLNGGTILADFIIEGQNANLSTITVLPAASVTNTEFRECRLTGTLDGGCIIRQAVAYDIDYVNGFLFQTMLVGTIKLGGSGSPPQQLHILECYSGSVDHESIPVIDCNNVNVDMSVQSFSGNLKMTNKTEANDFFLGFASGELLLDSTVTTGHIHVTGVCVLDDQTTGSVLVDDKTTGSSAVIATTVWDKQINGVVVGSFGEVAKQDAFQGHIHVDVNDGVAGTAYPLGTHIHPVNSIADAVAIGIANGLSRILVEEDVTFLATDNVDGFIIKGAHASKSQFTLTPGVSTEFTEFNDCNLTGTASGSITVRTSLVDTLDGFQGILHQTMINGTLTLAGTRTVHILDCFSGVAGSGTPEIDMNVAGPGLALRNFNGGVKLVNKTGPESVSMDINSGQVVLDGTVTNGEIVVRGVAHLTDNSTATVVTDGLINTEVAAVQVDVTNILAVVEEIRKYDKNRTKIDDATSTMTIYDDDGTTPIRVFDLKDENGLASFTEIFERLPQ